MCEVNSFYAFGGPSSTHATSDQSIKAASRCGTARSVYALLVMYLAYSAKFLYFLAMNIVMGK